MARWVCVGVAIGGLMSAAAGAYAGQIAVATGGTATQDPLTLYMIVLGALALVLFSLQAAVCLHELSHFVAVRRVGWTCLALHMSWFHATFTNGRTEISWWRPRGLIGAVLYFPKNARAGQAALVVGAGAAANFAAALASFAIGASLAAAGEHELGLALAGLAFKFNAFLSVVVGMAALVPQTTSFGAVSDGLQLWRAWRRPVEYCRALRLSEISAPLCGIRPRDWPQNALDLIDAEPAVVVWLHRHRYLAALDGGDVRAAADQIGAAWNGIHELDGLVYQQAVIAYEAAMFYTRFVAYPEIADAAFAFGVAARPKCTIRAEAEVARLFMAGNTEEAAKKAERHLKLVARIPVYAPAMLEHVREWYARILDSDIQPITPGDMAGTCEHEKA